LKNSNEWHTLAEASRILGKNNRYVSNWIKRNNDFPEQMLMEIARTKFIHDKGIQWISENTKKGGVLASSRSAVEDKFLKLPILGNALRTILHGWERGI